MLPSTRMLSRAICVATVIAASAPLAACTHSQNAYDPATAAQRRWDRREERAYRRWEAERQLQHLRYEQRNIDEQRAYWLWRRDHPNY
jgi:hypothetical protein